jgi:hypothetical protein
VDLRGQGNGVQGAELLIGEVDRKAGSMIFATCRHGEILLVAPHAEGGLRADVYNTIGRNDCPQETWSALDAQIRARGHRSFCRLAERPTGLLAPRPSVRS